MVSDFAIDEIEEALVAKGLTPTPRDIVRLNAIGLRLEAAQGRDVADCTYLLPRVAAVSKTLFFRQPTVGHEIWLDQVSRFIKPGDYQSALAINAYALSRPQGDLPDPDDPETFGKAVREFAATCRDLTRDQIYAAIRYVKYGSDPTANEHPASPKTNEGDDPDNYDMGECIALGVLNEGRAVLWGITEADLRNMTTAELHAVIDRAYDFHQMKKGDSEDFWQGRFYATLDEIAARLTKEKDNGPENKL